MLSLRGRTVILVDDGIATGVTDTAALEAVRRQEPRRVIIAVPVCAPEAARRIGAIADEMVCLSQPGSHVGVGQSYRDFSQVSDEEVIGLLGAGLSRGGANGSAEVAIPVADAELRGELQMPASATGLVIFAHGSGSSRLSPRNAAVAARLREAGLGTLLFDLLTSEESGNRAKVFDIALLAERLIAVTRWMLGEPGLGETPIGYFGASTGAAAALVAAAEIPEQIDAVVSRGGRPDLAGPSLSAVQAPTLLIVGSEDHDVLELNRRAKKSIGAGCELAIVPGAGHLFSEPGTLEQVSELASRWFSANLGADRVTDPRG
jgi:pimeloyl-ACP methyl ester carboxylesterase